MKIKKKITKHTASKEVEDLRKDREKRKGEQYDLDYW